MSEAPRPKPVAALVVMGLGLVVLGLCYGRIPRAGVGFVMAARMTRDD
jgi:hypothetical protein